MTDDASRQVPPPIDASRHTLSVDETAVLFVEAGVPKSTRTIQRYCRSGILECIRTDAELGDRYLIDRASIERRIDELKRFAQIMASTEVPARPDVSRHDASRHDTSRRDTSRRDRINLGENEHVRELEAEVFNLKIDNRAKEIVINQLREERGGFFSRITEQATHIGELRTKLQQLVAPNSPVDFDGELSDAVIHDTTISPPRRGDNSQSAEGPRGVEL